MKLFLRASILFLIVFLAVSCSDNSTGPGHTGTLEITTHTKNGGSQSNGYSIAFLFSKHHKVTIGANSMIDIKNLKNVSYLIQLQGIPANCSVEGGNPRSVTVTSNQTTSVNFVVGCKSSTTLVGIKPVIEAAIQNHAFPGASYAIGHNSNIYLGAVGHYTYGSSSPKITVNTRFDLASLTKSIATTTAVMLLYDEGRIKLQQKVKYYLPRFAQNGKENVTIYQLLSHSSGLQAYLTPYPGETRTQIINQILALHLQYTPGSKSLYSDLNFVTLMLVVNKITGKPFAQFCENHIFKPLGMTHTGFMIDDNYRNSPLFAPTATNLQGVVNDPLARGLGGVSGNAGLYTTAADMAKFGEMYLHKGKVNGKQFIKASTIKLFTTRSNVPGSKRALGWMVEWREHQGFCSCGKYFSSASFGHRGYTGTVIWIDPRHNLFGVLLDNGTYPSGADDVSTIFPARTSFYNKLWELLILH